MTEKQKRFCDEYLIDLNATQAAIRAGYSPKTARANSSRLLTNAGIRAYLKEQLEKMHNEKTADAQEVLEYLTSVLRGQSQSEELVVEGVGEGQSQARLVSKGPSEKDRLKAAELLGKRYGLYREKMELDGKDLDLTITIDYGEAPDS